MYIYKHQNAAGSKITVTSTAKNIFDLINTAASTALINAGFLGDANAIYITPENGNIRVLFDGNNPTSTNGFLLVSGVTYFLPGVPLGNMKLIRASGDTICSVLIGKSKDGEGAASSGATSATGGGTSDVNLTQVGGATFALGQQLAASSLPIVLTAAQLSTLTPPAAITNYANETGGNLASIKAKTDNIPAQGQALAAASLPVVLTAIQVAALTPTTISKNAGVIDTNTQRVIEAGSSTSAVTSVADTASSTQLLASTPGRIKYSVFNNSTEILYLKNGTTASLTDFTVAIPPLTQFGYYEDDTYTGRVDGIWANNSTGAALITEYT